MTQPHKDLRAGSTTVAIPQLGFGVWQVPDDEAFIAVVEALGVGYRHIDTAKLYHNETGVGRALVQSGLPREEVFVTSKLWPTDFPDARSAFNASTERLGLDVLDLFLLHWPFPEQGRYVEAWEILVALRGEGRVRAVGVSNFEPAHLEAANAATGEYPAINQIELHPYLQQRELRAFHAEHGIVTEAWSPLASGKQVLDDPVIGAIAAKHGVSPAQAILAWQLALGNVVIPKSVTPSRIAENFDVFGISLDAEDMEAIEGLDRGMRTGPNPLEFNG